MNYKSIPAYLGILAALLTLSLSTSYFSNSKKRNIEQRQLIIEKIDNSISNVNEYIVSPEYADNNVKQLMTELSELKSEIYDQNENNKQSKFNIIGLILGCLALSLLVLSIYLYWNNKKMRSQNEKLAHEVIKNKNALKEERNKTSLASAKKEIDLYTIYDLIESLNNEISRLEEYKSTDLNWRNIDSRLMNIRDKFSLLGNKEIANKVGQIIEAIEDIYTNKDKLITPSSNEKYNITKLKSSLLNYITQSYEIKNSL